MYNENELACAEMDDCDTDSDIEHGDICPLRDDAKVIFKGHDGGIFCIELDEERNRVYTGGLDDKIYAWEMSTGRKINLLIGHCNSVIHIARSKSGKTLASGDLGGKVIIWKQNTNEEEWLNIHEIDVVTTVVGLTWSFSSDRELIYICDASGTVQSWLNEPFGKESVMYRAGKECLCCKFCLVLKDKWSAVLYGEYCGDHANCCNTNKLLLIHNSSDRTAPVNLSSVRCIEDNHADEGFGAAWSDKMIELEHFIAIGDWGQIIIVALTSHGYTVKNKIIKVPIANGELVDHVAFSNQLPYIAFSTNQGSMGVYDVKTECMNQTWNYGATLSNELKLPDRIEHIDGVCAICWSPTKHVFYTAGNDGRLCEWDGRCPFPGDVPTLWGFYGIVWAMRVTQDGASIITVSDDKTGRLFAF